MTNRRRTRRQSVERSTAGDLAGLPATLPPKEMKMDDFDIACADAQDEATLAIKHPVTGEVTTWEWTFYGPGHPKTIDVANRASREFLREQREQRQAQVNGKKWKAEDQSLDEIRSKAVENIVARTKTFTPVKMGAETITFSADAAAKLLLDRKKIWLFDQIADWLRDSENFIQASAKS